MVRPVRLVGRTKDIHSSTREQCGRDYPPQRNVNEKAMAFVLRSIVS